MKKYWDLFLGVAILIYILILNVISGHKIAFTTGFVALGVMFIVYHFIKDRLRKRRRLFKIFKVAVSIGFIFILLLEGIIITYPKMNTSKSDYILVLGAGLVNGKDPSLILKARLDATLDLINEYTNNSFIVVSGGQGSDESLSEAEAMKNYLVNKGIDEDIIIVEDKSSNTNENFRFSKEKIEKHSNKDVKDLNIKIVTTDFHAFRSRLLAKRAGYENISNYSGPTVWYLVPVTYLREAFALVKSVLFDR